MCIPPACFRCEEHLALQVAVGKDFRVSARAVRHALTRNTVMVVASAPSFPHGVIDDVEGIAEVRRWLQLRCSGHCAWLKLTRFIFWLQMAQVVPQQLTIL